MCFNRVLTFGIVALIIALTSCKTTKIVVSDDVFEEDLSKYRPSFEDQEDDGNRQKQEGVILTGHINAEIDSINKILISRNATRKNWDGFTIQIYTGNSRQEAETVKRDFESYYPDLQTSLIYFQPTYKVKAGAFFDRLEATKKYEEVKLLFPRALLIPEKLSIPDYGKGN